MLRWSPGAVRATVGVGGIGLMTFVMQLPVRHGLPAPFPLLFVLAFTPMLVFAFTGDIDKPWARRAQWLAIGWYAVGVLVAIEGLVERGFANHDMIFMVFVAIGAWPCVIAARGLRRGADRGRATPQVVARIAAAHQPDAKGLVLNGSRRKAVRLLLGGIVLTGCGFMPSLQREHPVIAWLCIVLFGLCTVFAALRLAFPSLVHTLTLDPAGMTTSTFGRKHLIRWTDVRGFGLMHIQTARMISITYAPDYQGQRSARRVSAGLSGVEGALPDTYEVGGAELVALLEAWRARFGNTA